ncbi:MAG: hypothetical protein QE487_15975 [Fluviicola sp.]|nr:hypothetical protein [Fluviicola sp.]
MKRNLLILFCAISANLFAQKTDLGTSQNDNVPRPDATTKPNLDDYPYYAVSVLFRNEDKLRDKEFLGKFNKMEFFFAELSITYNGKSESSPLYLLEKEKGKFSVAIFSDKTVVRKIPISKFSADLPTVNVGVETKLKNEPIEIIKKVSDKVGPIIENPASIYGPAAAKMVFGFLNDVVTNLSSSKTINASVSFDAFKPAELGIQPHSYKVVFICPNIPNPVPKSGLKIAPDHGGRLNLYVNNTLYTEYPYIIIETGLSNYLDEKGLPSRFNREKGSCDITKDELEKLTADFGMIKSRLSVQQLAAEENLLSFYKSKLIIAEGVAAQGSELNTEKLKLAYNALYDFRTRVNQTKINTILKQQHYEIIYTDLTTCVSQTANSLAMYRLLLPVFNIMDKELAKVDNSDLAVISSYIETTKELDFILETTFHSNVLNLQSMAENYIFSTKFEELVKSIIRSDIVNERLKSDVTNLIDLKNKNDKCRRCFEESQKAEKVYNDLVNNEKSRRNQILQVVEQSNEVYSKGYAALQRLLFTIEKTKNPDTNAPTIPIPVNPTLFEQTLKNLKANKEMLNEILAKPYFSSTDIADINSLITKCNLAINETNDIVEVRLKTLFETNKGAFTDK